MSGMNTCIVSPGKAGPDASGVPLNLQLHYTKLSMHSLKKSCEATKADKALLRVITVFIKEQQSKGCHMVSYSLETNPRHLKVIFIAQHI